MSEAHSLFFTNEAHSLSYLAVKGWEVQGQEYCACRQGLCFELYNPKEDIYSRVHTALDGSGIAESTVFWEFYEISRPNEVLQVSLHKGGIAAIRIVCAPVLGRIDAA
jgi:hypothetical protein